MNNTFRRWNNFALRIARTAATDHLRTENIDVIGNDFRKPRPGLYRSVIFITRAESLVYILNVRVNRNTIVSDGGAFQIGDTTSNATGDQIVLHGVNGFQITENSVFFGGENGITASTLSRNGIISRNIVHGNDTHGIIIGSGYYELSVNNASNFSVGDEIRGVETGTQATIRNIRVHPADGRNILGLDRVIGGRVFREEPITNLTTGAVEVDSSFIVDRTKYITVVDNIVFGNGRDQANNTPFTFGIFSQNADTIDFRRNRIFNPDYAAVEAAGGIQNQRLGIFLANSRNILVAPSNVFEQGAETVEEAIGMNASSWLR